MDLGRLAPASEVTGSEDICIPYHFEKGMVCPYMVCPPPATSDTGALDGQDPCQTRKTATLVAVCCQADAGAAGVNTKKH
jgi:hypothetical protein